MTAAFDKTVTQVRYRMVRYFRGKLIIILFNLMDTVRLGVPVLLFEKDKLVINLFSVKTTVNNDTIG